MVTIHGKWFLPNNVGKYSSPIKHFLQLQGGLQFLDFGCFPWASLTALNNKCTLPGNEYHEISFWSIFHVWVNFFLKNGGIWICYFPGNCWTLTTLASFDGYILKLGFNSDVFCGLYHSKPPLTAILENRILVAFSKHLRQIQANQHVLWMDVLALISHAHGNHFFVCTYRKVGLAEMKQRFCQ